METDCSATLTLRGESQSIHLKAGRATEFSAKIPNDYRGQIVLTVRVGTAYEREYRIFCNEMPNMDFVALDALVRHLQQPLLEDLEPDWSLFRSTYIQGMGSNPLETRYLSGFYEYLLGSFLEKNNDQAARVHYEQAFGYLRPFKTHLAHTACSILALKMNWFWMLKRCKVNSKFYLPNIFFNHSLWDNRLFTAAPSATVARTDGLWIDSFQEALLEALQRYYVRDLQGVMTISTQLKNHSFIRDRNNADKVALLEGRSLLMQGNRVAAVGVYRQLRYHPLFGHEVEEVIA